MCDAYSFPWHIDWYTYDNLIVSQKTKSNIRNAYKKILFTYNNVKIYQKTGN